MDKLGLNFGLIIAYFIPGFLGVFAVAKYENSVKALLGGSSGTPESPSVVLLLLLALAIGIIINAFSWAFVRPLITLSGVKRPATLDYTKLRKEDIEVYNVIIESNFRYHQFYANMLVAVLILSPAWLVRPLTGNVIRNVSFFLVSSILFLAARDSLQRAYKRMLALQERGDQKTMTNGDPGPIPKKEVPEKEKEPKREPEQKQVPEQK